MRPGRRSRPVPAGRRVGGDGVLANLAGGDVLGLVLAGGDIAGDGLGPVGGQLAVDDAALKFGGLLREGVAIGSEPGFQSASACRPAITLPSQAA